MRITAGFLMLVITAAAGPTLATPLAPENPSQVVTLLPDVLDGSNGPCGLTRTQVDGLINPDGSLSPFTIPPGQVLVLTAGTWSASGLTPGSSNTLVVSLTTATNDAGIVLGPSVLANSAGRAAGAFTVQPGIVIKAGASLCVAVESDGTNVFNVPRLYGFFTKEK